MKRTRREKLELSLSAEEFRDLSLAAAAARRSVREFVIESAIARAAEIVPFCHRFAVSAEAWAAFQFALDAPTTVKPRLKRLRADKSVFERGSRD